MHRRRWDCVVGGGKFRFSSVLVIHVIHCAEDDEGSLRDSERCAAIDEYEYEGH